MPASDIQAQRDSSRQWNEDVLIELGFRRVANTSIFRNSDGIALLSPGVGVVSRKFCKSPSGLVSV